MCVCAHIPECVFVLTYLGVCVYTHVYVYVYLLCPYASLMSSHAIKFQAASTGAMRPADMLLLGRKSRGIAKAFFFASSSANSSHPYLPCLKWRIPQAHHLECLKVCSRDSPHLPGRMGDGETLGIW